MNVDMAQHVYPSYLLKPDAELARKFLHALGAPHTGAVPPTYLIFLRGERLGVDLFADLDIPRHKALHGGQRYEWFSPVNFEDELSVTTTIAKITEKEGKRGKIWFVDVTYDYRRTRDNVLAVRETTRLVKLS